jgi:anaerobic dimethyl sulfoxide reductase subunit B (iron-sulfur subunit)
MSIQYGFSIDIDRCVQCHSCEVACKSINGIELGPRWRQVIDFWIGEYPAVGNYSVSISCHHCASPSCADACPVQAITKREADGIVVVDPETCTGCRTCEDACPYGAPQFGQDGVMQKCNLCVARTSQGLQPSCVATCPGEALKFGTVEQLTAQAGGKELHQLQSANGPSFFYTTTDPRLDPGILSAILEKIRHTTAVLH